MNMDALKLEPNEYGGVETRAKRSFLSRNSSETLKFKGKCRTVSNSKSRIEFLCIVYVWRALLILIEFTLQTLLWEPI